MYKFKPDISERPKEHGIYVNKENSANVFLSKEEEEIQFDKDIFKKSIQEYGKIIENEHKLFTYGKTLTNITPKKYSPEVQYYLFAVLFFSMLKIKFPENKKDIEEIENFSENIQKKLANLSELDIFDDDNSVKKEILENMELYKQILLGIVSEII